MTSTDRTSTDRLGPSETARRVAAYRRRFDRLTTESGDPSADERLADDVSADVSVDLERPMARLLRGRTAFFDRVVVNALDRGVRQLVSVGAGYDGRALRYARDGVRWFELDHPATQQDKLSRLDRLGIAAPQVTFIGSDLRDADVDAALVDHGYEPEAPSVICCEGVATYLEPAELRAMLGKLRHVATVGTRLAITFSSPSTSDEHAERRRQFEEAVAAMGEPARAALSGDEAADLLLASRWLSVELSAKATRSGFVVAAPLWTPPSPDQAGTTGVRTSRVGSYMEQTFHRAGTADLAAHLEATRGIRVRRSTELDVGVFRVDRLDGPSWIARVFPEARPLARVESDASVLRQLRQDGFPAERCAHADAVSTFHGQGVLVTQLVVGKRAKSDRGTFAILGDMLGRLHGLSHPWIRSAPSGGAWHHLALEGGPPEEVAAASSLLQACKARVSPSQVDDLAALCDAVAGMEDGHGLPVALVHPDFVPANAIVDDDGTLTMVDWAGVGRGPRLSSVGFLLWAAGANNLRHVDAVAAAYLAHVRLEPAELDRLAGAVLARPLVFEAWAYCTGRKSLAEVVDGLPALRQTAEQIAARAAKTFAP